MKLGHSDHKNLMFIYNLIQSSDSVDLDIIQHLSLDEYLDIIDITWSNHSFSIASHIIEFALSKFPENIDLIESKIQNLIHEKDYSSAFYFLKGYASDFLLPFDVKIIELDIHLKMNQFEKAGLLIETILASSDEQESMVTLYKGLIELQAQNPYRAMEYFKESVLLWPENQKAQTQVSKLMLSDNTLEENESFIDTVLNINPFAYQFWYCKGKIYNNRGEYQEALEAFDFAYVSCEQYLPAIEAKLELFLEAERYEYALQELIIIIEDFEPIVYHYIKTASCFRHLGKSDKARQILHFALEIYPEEEDLFYELSLIEVEEEDYSLALEFILQAINLNDANEDFHTAAALIYESLDKYILAEAHLKESLSLDDTNQENWLRLCTYSFDIGNYETCLEVISESKEHIYSNKIEVLEAAIYFEKNERSIAFDILNKVIEEDIHSVNEIFIHIPTLENDVEIKALLQVYQPI